MIYYRIKNNSASYVGCDSDWAWCYANASQGDALIFAFEPIKESVFSIRVDGLRGNQWLSYRGTTGAVGLYDEPTPWEIIKTPGGVYLKSVAAQTLMGTWSQRSTELYVRSSMYDYNFTLEPFDPGSESLVPYDLVGRMLLLDVWGEGRILADGLVTGFPMAYNLNKSTQKISNGPNKGADIPNLVPVTDYDNPQFPLKDGMVNYVTLMGAPITEGTAREIYRVLNKSSGVVFLFGPDDADRMRFEREKGRLEYKPQDPINHPFNQITLRPVYVYGFPGVNDHNEL